MNQALVNKPHGAPKETVRRPSGTCSGTGRAPHGVISIVWAPHDARTMTVPLYMSHGHREATVRTSCGARTVIVGIAIFFECKNITKSYGDRKNITPR